MLLSRTKSVALTQPPGQCQGQEAPSPRSSALRLGKQQTLANGLTKQRQSEPVHPAHQHTSLPRVVMLPASTRTRLLPSVFLGSYTTAAHACPVIYLSKYQCVYYRLFPLWPSLVAQQKRICLQRRGCRLDPWVKKIPWRRKWQPTPAFLAWKIPWAEEPGGLESMGSQSRI